MPHVGGRTRSLILTACLFALALFPAASGHAQETHVEFQWYLSAVGKVVLSFDLPADYTVTERSDISATVEGPTMMDSSPEPWRTWLSIHSYSPYWIRATAKEAAYEIPGAYLGDRAGPILAEGSFTGEEVEGYFLRVRHYLYAGQVDTYSTTLFMVVRVASEGDPLLYPPPEPGGNAYVELVVQGGLETSSNEELFLETGESVAQWVQRGFDAILGSLTVSTPSLEEPTPTSEASTPTPTAATAADAQETHVEFSVTEPIELVLSFDLPGDYTVTDTGLGYAEAEGPPVAYPGGPEPETLTVFAMPFGSSEAPREAVYEEAARALGDQAGPIVEESPVAVGEFEGYAVQWRSYNAPGVTDTYSTVLFVALRVLDDPEAFMNYLLLSADANPMEYFGLTGEELFLESGESVAQANQRVFDAIVGSLTVSAPPVGETPTPEPVTPTPEPGTPTATPVPAAGGRVELGPLEFDGSEVRVSFALPSGYTIVDRRKLYVEFDGPIVQYGPQLLPDKYWVSLVAFDSTGDSAQAARAWSEQEQISPQQEGGCGEFAFPVEQTFRLGELEAYLLEVGFRCFERTEAGYDYLFAALAATVGEDTFLIVQVDHSLAAYDTFAPFEPLSVAGQPFPEVRQAIFDTILGSLSVSVEDLGAPQSEFVGSVPGPDQISTDPEVIGSNIFLALFVILAFAFTSTLFNQTLDENRREIEGWVGRFFVPLRRLTRIVEHRYGAVAERQPWVERVGGPAVILLLTGLIYGFLSPDFGFNTKSVVLFVSVVIGVGAITYVYEGGQALFTRRRFRLGAGVKLYAVALAVAAGCVLLSRLVDFQPGFLYGFVAAYTLLAPAALDRRQSGQTVFFPAIVLLALSLIAWLLVIPLREVTQGSDAWWVALPEGAAVAVFVAALEGLFFNMIPLSFMDGAKIAEWNRFLWFLMFGAAGFLFWWVLLNQEGAYADALAQRRVVAVLSLLAFWSVVTLVTWAYFRGRVYGWAMPSVATVRGTVAGWARGAIERVPRIRWRRGSR